MKKGKEETKETKAALLKAALHVFAEKGFTATRLTDIAERAGFTRGAIYWHFKNKTDVLISLLREKTNDINSHALTILKEDITAGNKIKKMLEGHFSLMLSDIDFYANQQLKSLIIGQIHQNQEIGTIVNDMKEQLVSTLCKIIKQGQQTGEFRAEMDPVDAAFFLLSSLFGITSTIRILESDLDNKRRFFDAMIEFLGASLQKLREN